MSDFKLYVVAGDSGRTYVGKDGGCAGPNDEAKLFWSRSAAQKFIDSGYVPRVITEWFVYEWLVTQKRL